MFRNFTIGTLLVLFLAGCSSSPSQATNLNGVWGGVLTTSGYDFAIFAMDVSTSVSGSSGTVSGYGLMSDLSASGDVYLSVSGSTGPNSLSIVLTDYVGDTIRLTASPSGQRIDGTWSYPREGLSGTFRMAREENIHLLGAAPASTGSGYTFQELFRTE